MIDDSRISRLILGTPEDDADAAALLALINSLPKTAPEKGPEGGWDPHEPSAQSGAGEHHSEGIE
jgi:hypothetical protein